MDNGSIVFFDGDCSLCNGWIDFLIKRDLKRKFSYASLQSDVAKQHLKEEFPKFMELNTIIYLRGDQVFDRSSAVLKILQDLGRLYVLVGVFWIFPKFFRDTCYAFVAKNRYKWFGKKNTCRIPTKEERELFLELK